MKSRYRCLACGQEFEKAPGPTDCPRCGHVYVKWLNVEEVRAWSEARRLTSQPSSK